MLELDFSPSWWDCQSVVLGLESLFLPSNHFARIIDNLDELAQIGIRTHEQGLENIIIKEK